tara:strand:+ start:195 stop:821 length:627 start_codon:yes stop_codon:yes gene_type:complete
MEELQIRSFRPNTLGWLECKLPEEVVDYLWKLIDARSKVSCKKSLVGNLKESNYLSDQDGWFFENVIKPMCYRFAQEYGNLGNTWRLTNYQPYIMKKMWVNFQRQHEFNPLHDHDGVYSFVIFMKIPTEWDEQNALEIAKDSHYYQMSGFEFQFLDMLGSMVGHTYKMGKEYEGTMLFFPSKLRHQVYPFFNCDEERITISGNIGFNL